jgi:uncharacterized membrane protein YdjX (TVP38/TMEM64 family)
MRAIWRLVFGVFGLFLFIFIVSLAMGVPIDGLVGGWLGNGGLMGMVLSILLLMADVFLPVPSSLIMVVNGALYGVVLGSAISLVGGMGAAMVGYYLGRGGEALALRWIGAQELELGRAFFHRWGILAVAISRPIPLISETVIVMAGLAGWSLRRCLISAALGLSPIVIIYALSGAFAQEQDYAWLTVAVVAVVSGIGWWLGRFFKDSDQSTVYSED